MAARGRKDGLAQCAACSVAQEEEVHFCNVHAARLAVLSAAEVRHVALREVAQEAQQRLHIPKAQHTQIYVASGPFLPSLWHGPSMHQPRSWAAPPACMAFLTKAGKRNAERWRGKETRGAVGIRRGTERERGRQASVRTRTGSSRRPPRRAAGTLLPARPAPHYAPRTAATGAAPRCRAAAHPRPVRACARMCTLPCQQAHLLECLNEECSQEAQRMLANSSEQRG